MRWASRVPIGRVGEAREAGDLVTFLVSDRAAYITGVAVNIDGGTSPVGLSFQQQELNLEGAT